MSERESDRHIVAKKQGNACRVKGPAPMRRDSGQHSPDTEPEIKGMGTKLDLIAFRSEHGWIAVCVKSAHTVPWGEQ
jgi:hypothetical protein